MSVVRGGNRGERAGDDDEEQEDAEEMRFDFHMLNSWNERYHQDGNQ